MADNLTLNAGSGGSTAATDDVGGVHFQKVKIADGTADSSAMIGGDATNGLDVDVTRVSGNVTVVQGTAANLKVDASGVAVPVTDNSGSLTVDGTVAASNLPTTVDVNSGTKSASTLRVVLATDQPALTNKLLVTPDLPSGASTAAKQPALGTAGTASTDVITIQGIASMTKLLVTPDSVALPANQSTNVAQLAGTTTDTNSGTKSAGTLRVVLATDQPALTNKLLVTPDANSAVNVAQINGVTPLMGAGNTGTGSARVTIATDQVVIPVSDNAGSLTVDAPLGTPVFVTTTPSTTGGWTVFMATSGDGSTALTATAQAVKASAGTLGGWYIYNPNATATYVIIYNTASGSVTVGTTNPVMVLCIPATSAANLEMTNGINFGTAIAVAATTTGGGNTAPSTALEANFWYK